MYDPVNEALAARERHNELLREAAHYRLVRSVQAPQSTLLDQLQSQLIVWTDLARPQHKRTQHA